MFFHEYFDVLKFTVVPAFSLPFLLLGIYRMIAATKKPVLADARRYLFFCLLLILVSSAIRWVWPPMSYVEIVFALFFGLLPYCIIGFFQLRKKIRPWGIVISLVFEYLSLPIWFFVLFLLSMMIDPPD